MPYAILFDTLCQGFQPVRENDEPLLFATEAEALQELASDPEFYRECFVDDASRIGHRTIFRG